MRIVRLSLAAAVGLSALLIAYAGLYDDPPIAKTFLDRNGRVIGTLNPAYQGLQYWTPLDQIPSAVIQKTIRTEDRWFYWHRGINPFSVASAIFDNVSSGRVVRGGSTITQQLAKNLMGPLPRTWLNKFRESLLALSLEMKHSKAWILERYLNTVYYGQRSYGIAAAAKTYFGKDLTGLSSGEIEFLIDRPRAPNRPVGAIRESPLQTPRLVARHFLEFVSKNLSTDANVIPTTLDLDLQTKLEDATARLLASRAYEDPKLSAAVVVIDVKTGNLLAMVGSRDYFDEAIDGQVNAATALRQPGSTLKPFTYFAAFSRGFGPDSIVPDEPLSFQAPGVEEAESYAPQNFDRLYHGDMTIREALANSYNIPAVVTLNQIGLSYYHDLLKSFGFTTLTKPPMHYGLAVTLGSGEVTLLELTNAYAALARGGIYSPYAMTAPGGPSKGFSGEPPLDRKSLRRDRTRREECAAMVTDILSDPTARLKAFGFNDSMTIEGHDVAVKTGTSYEHRDNWTVGYTPSYAVGVWVGHADGSPMLGESLPTTGATGAAPLWHATMENILRDRAPEKFAVRAMQIEYSEKPPVHEALQSVRIISPVPNAIFRLHSHLPTVHQKIAAQAGGTSHQTLRWFVDDRYIGSTQGSSKVWILPEPGRHRLRVRAEDGSEEEVAFKVVGEESL